jgi:peptidylprolyl isomerase
MGQAKHGDTVKVHYTGRLDDGNVFDTSADREPLEFTIGSGQVIQGFDQLVTGLNPGESRTQKIAAENAYGPHLKDMEVEVPRTEIPPHLDPKVGDQYQLQGNGQTFRVLVTSVSETSVTMDGNHPLAGRDLTFEVSLVEIVSA